MTGRDDRTRSIQNYLDGYLTPDQEAGIRRRIRDREEWRREHDELRAVYSLLDTPLDVDPPADLLPGVFEALEADAIRRSERFRLPTPVENGLVFAGAAGMAGLLVGVGRYVTTEGVLGRLAVGGATALSTAKHWLVEGVGAAVHLDWASRTFGTLADAGRTVLGAASEPLLGVALISVALTFGLGWLVLRSGAPGSQGGWSHG